MKTVGNKVEPFKVVGVKPGFNLPEENGVSAFEEITETVVPGQVEGHLLLPEGLHLRLSRPRSSASPSCKQDFDDRDAVLLAARPTTSSSSSRWRREHKDLDRLNHWQFADVNGLARRPARRPRRRRKAWRCARRSSSTRTT